MPEHTAAQIQQENKTRQELAQMRMHLHSQAFWI